MRSPTGGGKSTTAAKLAPKENIFETDNYWYKGGKYVFDATKLGAAHQWNKDQVDKAMQEEKSPIVVANTNITEWEYKPYVSLAKSHGYTVEFKFPESPWFQEVHPRMVDKTFTDADVKLFFEKSTHGVPFDNVKKMLSRWEE